MRNISTVNGAISTNDLGFSLIHEHLIFDYNEKYRNLLIDYVRGKLASYKSAGGNTIVDLSPFRKIDWVIDICKDIDLNVILSTGYYLETEKELCGGIMQGKLSALLPKGALNRSIEEHCEMMERDITEGIGNSGIKAGIIKVAADTDTELSTWEKNVFTAAAKTSVKLKVPIATHACIGQRVQQDALLKAGADLRHVFYSHAAETYLSKGRDKYQELQFYLDLIKEGSNLEFNIFGYYFHTPKDELLFFLRSLADKGYINHIFISMDMFYEIDDNGKIWHDAEKVHPETYIRDYTYIIKNVIPVLRDEVGFSNREIDIIFKENPKRLFDW